MGRERINFRNAGHERYDGRSDGTTGADQVAVLQRILNQFLGRHINHVIVTGNNIVKLRIHALDKQFRRIVTVETVELAVNQTFQVFYRILDLRGKQVMGHGPQCFTHIRDQIGIGNNDLIRLFLTQIAELFQHLIGGTEV